MPKVIVTVPPRPEFGNAYWALGRKFNAGATVLDVSDDELVDLKGQPVMSVTLVSDVMDHAASVHPDAAETAAKAAVDAAEAAKNPGKPLKR